MNILLVYGTTEGQTRKIAGFIKTDLEKAKHVVTLCDATDQPVSPDGFDSVMIAASVHAGKYQGPVQNYIQKHKVLLNRLHSAFISVSLTAAGDDEVSWKELHETTVEFLSSTGWKPAMVEYVAGAILFSEYDFFKKYIMRLIAKKAGHPSTQDTEYTDWNKLSAFLKKYTDQWLPAPESVCKVETDQEAVA